MQNQPQISEAGNDISPKKRILVFSPDQDLAKSLSLLLEGTFEIICETQTELLCEKIKKASPSLFLIDLFSFPKDIMRVLDIIKISAPDVPTITLHVFQRRIPEVEAAIQEVSDLVLYKPLEVDAIGEAVTRLIGSK